MILRPPRSPPTYTLFPYTTLFRALAGLQRSGQALGQPEHLAARIELEAERRDGRRGLQPASGRRRRDHVAPAIDDVEVDGVARPFYAGLFGEVRHGRLVDAGLRDARSLDDRHAAAKLVLEPGHAAGARVVGGALGDK